MMSHQTYRIGVRASQSKGIAAVFIVLLAATLAGLSMLVLDFGKGSLRVSTEKQLLDSHGTIVGQHLVKHGLAATCQNGQFTGDVQAISATLFNGLEEIEADDRTYQCEELDGGQVITREEDGPDGPAGTYRRYRVSSSYDPTQSGNESTRSVIVEVREISGEVERPRPQIMFILDYSGSMGMNGRIGRLKSAMQGFVNGGYEVDYGAILFNHGVISTIGISSGHDAQVMALVNGRDADGGTNFLGPLQNAVTALNATGNPHSYIVLVSDGVPADGGPSQSFVNNQIRGIDPTICSTRNGPETCHTVYTLGVDDADMNMLDSLSGNAATNPANYQDFSIEIESQDIQDAFGAIVDDILCSFGPLVPQPTPEEEDSIHVFLNDEPLTSGVDFLYDRNLNAVKLYDDGPLEACKAALENDEGITIRFGRPRVIPDGDAALRDTTRRE
jgi:hypothetical protein